MRLERALSPSRNVVEMVAVLLHTGQDTAAENSILRLVPDIPERHLALVPHLVALLQELEVEDIADFRVTGSPQLLVLVDNAHVHEHLIALAAAVEETLLASEEEDHVFIIAGAAGAPDNAFRRDGRDQHRVLDRAERPDHRRTLEVLVELDNAHHVLRLLIHDDQ